jgi:GMP synthase (glutamine-hydrolysing)
VIGAVSGGVDSTVAAKIMDMAIGARFHPIFVDNGMLRLGEVEQVERMFKDDLKIDLTVSHSAAEFISLLKGKAAF